MKTTKRKKTLPKMKIFNFENINPLWVLPNKFLLKCWTIFIHNIWVLLIENDKNDKKNEKSLTKRLKISNCNTPIPFQYGQNVLLEMLNNLYIYNMNYLNCKRWKWLEIMKKHYHKMKFFTFKNTNSLWVLPNEFLLKYWTIFIYNIWVI